MPIYEYRCDSCGAELEKLQKISDPALRECPACGREALVKRVSAASFRLKGSGWYETDFKTGKKKNGVADTATDAGQAAPSEAKQGANAKSNDSGNASSGNSSSGNSSSGNSSSGNSSSGNSKSSGADKSSAAGSSAA